MSKKFTLILAAGLTVLLLFALSTQFGSAPPFGKFFHPAAGFWSNAEIRETTGTVLLQTNGLNESVEVYFDDRGVPHIFAKNDDDLYFAQGYITARDRLFQMELQIRAAGGRLAEWLGPGLIEYDRNQRRLGMMYGAEKSLEGIQQNDEIRKALEAYSEGVNAYIETLRYETYPLEYKLLDVEPEKWAPLKTSLLLKYMTQMLAGRSEDFRMSNTMAHFGEEFVNQFLSKRPDLMDPIIPPETGWNFTPLETEKPDEIFRPSYTDNIELWQPNPLNGSNNWVVDGSKTAEGYPILSNDMHLGMTMPAIWYEIQLHTPDSNVYGVSLMGTPTVIVGFNEHIAWGSTNTGADVMDWYEITFQDENRTHYLHDGEWLPVEERVEVIEVKGSDVVRDSILYTHHGPVYETEQETSISQRIQKDHALRWVAHDPSNELLTFYRLNRAQNYDDFREAFRTYQAPAQNMNFADVNGDIAMQTGGKFPVKWEFQGRTVGDGTDSRYDWNEFIPFEHNPLSLNPERGFLSAANQYPAAEDYPYYLGEAFAPYERGRRINDLLKDMNDITVEDFQEMFMDNFSYHALHLLPVLLDGAETLETTEFEQNLLEQLNNWDYQNEGSRVEPSLFHYWWRELYSAIWDNKYNSEYPMSRPDRDITVELILNDPGSHWFNNIQTEETETLEDIIHLSFREAISALRERFGEPVENWEWGYVNNTSLNHIAQIPGLGEPDLFTGGGAESINAIRGSHGPSWRMIVELDPEGVRGYGVYPGGQTGNPGSDRYNEFVETWRTGELYELLFLREKPVEKGEFPLMIRLE